MYILLISILNYFLQIKNFNLEFLIKKNENNESNFWPFLTVTKKLIGLFNEI